jgi:hypothetical protein
MIVQPDFADHWKTDMLVRLSGSEASVRCLLRFWSHCQNRKQWRFNNFTPEILAAICKWTGDANAFWSAMTQTFAELREDGTLIAHEWEDMNATLLARWKGGKATQKKWSAHSSAKAKPRPSQGDKIREDKSREDKIEKKGLTTFVPPSDAGASLRGKFEEWMQFRRGLGKKPKHWAAMFEEQWKWLQPFGEPMAIQVLTQSIRNGWQGLFEVKDSQNNQSPAKPRPKFIDRTGETNEQQLARQLAEASKKLGGRL